MPEFNYIAQQWSNMKASSYIQRWSSPFLLISFFELKEINRDLQHYLYKGMSSFSALIVCLLTSSIASWQCACGGVRP